MRSVTTGNGCATAMWDGTGTARQLVLVCVDTSKGFYFIWKTWINKVSLSLQKSHIKCYLTADESALRVLSNRPFATSEHVVQNPPCWRASSLLFPHWLIKTKRPEPVKLDLPLFWCLSAGIITSLPSSTWSLVAKGLLISCLVMG